MLLLISAGLFGAYYFVQQQILLPGLVELEEAQARETMRRVQKVLEMEIEDLLTECRAMSEGNEIYEFLENKDPQFIEEHFFRERLKLLRLNLVSIIDENGEVLSTQLYGKRFKETLEPEVLIPGSNVRDLPIHRAENGKALSGLAQRKDGRVIFAACPILLPGGRGKPRGTLVLGKFFSDLRVEELGRFFGVPFTAELLTPYLFKEGTEGKIFATSKKDSDGQKCYYTDTNDPTRLKVYTFIRDDDGKPLLKLETEFPREFFAKETQSNYYVTGFLIIISTVMLLFLAITLQRVLVGPIQSLTRFASHVGETGDLSLHFHTKRSDEIGTLATVFNQMVENLRKSQDELLNLSHKTGMAETARHMLHNIGNVMTNTTVLADRLKTKLSASRLSGLENAADMLAENKENLAEFLTTDERGQMLPRYLEMLAEVWRDEQREMFQDTDALEKGLEHISQILSQQRDLAQQGSQTLLPCNIADLLKSVVGLLKSSLEQSDVVVDLHLQHVPWITVDSVKLTQVLINLVTNAKDALIHNQPGSRHIVITLSLEYGASSTESYIVVEIYDNGVGIPNDKLITIFSGSFTTKEYGTGQGLHFCANAMNEMNGSIKAQSEGPGTGATFTLLIPVEEPKEKPKGE